MANLLESPRDPNPTGMRRIWTYLETAASIKYSTLDDVRKWLQDNLSIAASRIASGVIKLARLSQTPGTPGQFFQWPSDGSDEGVWGDAPAADALNIHDRLTTRMTAPDGADRLAASDESEAGDPTKWLSLTTLRTWLQAQLRIDASRITSGIIDKDRVIDTSEAEDGDLLFFRGDRLHLGKVPRGRGNLLFSFDLPTAARSLGGDITPAARTINDDPAPPAGFQLPTNDDTRSIQVPYLPPDNIRGLWAVAKVGEMEISAAFMPYGASGARSTSASGSRAYAMLVFSDRTAVEVEWEISLTVNPAAPGRGSFIRLRGVATALEAGSRVEFYEAP